MLRPTRRHDRRLRTVRRVLAAVVALGTRVRRGAGAVARRRGQHGAAAGVERVGRRRARPSTATASATSRPYGLHRGSLPVGRSPGGAGDASRRPAVPGDEGRGRARWTAAARRTSPCGSGGSTTSARSRLTVDSVDQRGAVSASAFARQSSRGREPRARSRAASRSTSRRRSGAMSKRRHAHAAAPARRRHRRRTAAARRSPSRCPRRATRRTDRCSRSPPPATGTTTTQPPVTTHRPPRRRRPRHPRRPPPTTPADHSARGRRDLPRRLQRREPRPLEVAPELARRHRRRDHQAGELGRAVLLRPEAGLGQRRVPPPECGRPAVPGEQRRTYPYASGLVESAHDFTFTYGRMEARIWLPPGSGQAHNWPAFWANGTGTWPVTGELDVMEALEGHACWHFHSTLGGPGGCAPLPNPGGLAHVRGRVAAGRRHLLLRRPAGRSDRLRHHRVADVPDPQPRRSRPRSPRRSGCRARCSSTG